MIDDLKTYCMAFIQLIQTNPARKTSSDFSMELNELQYNATSGLHAVYKDTKNNKTYDVIVLSRTNNDHRFLPEKL